MIHLFSQKKLVVATHNAGKVVEFEQLLALPGGIKLVTASSLGLPEPEETGRTFAENAELKARAACEASGLPALADDSGLSVEALNSDPGIYSARWAGPTKDFGLAMEKIRCLLEEKGLKTSRAAFVAALCLAFPDGKILEAEGRVEGHLAFPPRGKNGFGYDPIFIPEGETRSFAEMSKEEKSRLSHRARAVEKLKKILSAL